MGQHSEANLNYKYIEMAKLMNIYLNHFPKHEKYGLCLQIRNAAYEMYGCIVELQRRHHKKTAINTMIVRHEQLRMLTFLAHELGYFAFKNGKVTEQDPKKVAAHRYLVLSRHIDEIGRIIGSWVKVLDSTVY